MERKVREILLYLQEVFQIEYFVQGTCTIEVSHLTVSSMQCLRQVHDLCTQRSHTGTTTNPHHFLLRIEYRVEVSVRTAHDYLITRFQSEDIRRSNTCRHIHKALSLIFRLERRSCDTYRQHDTVTFCRIVSHRISTDRFFIIVTLQCEQTEFFPCRQILITNQTLINVLVIVH